MRHTKLKDDPTVRWREELVSDIILRQVQLVNSLMGKCIELSGNVVNIFNLCQSFQVASLSIDTCVTFDRHGVSGHRNHISLYYALACLAMEDRERSVFCLTSVNPFLPRF